MLATSGAAVAQEAALNFVVAGEWRSGAAVLQGALNRVPGMICHGDLCFSEYGSPGEQEERRLREHADYFRGDAGGLHEGGNPTAYLNGAVFDRPMAGESHVGVKLLYPFIERHQLYDLLQERWRDGDFCVVHVVRNPVACLVSARQAARWGVWRSFASSPDRGQDVPPPVSLDPDEVVQFARRWEATLRKIRASCPDALEVRYRDLVQHWQPTLRGVFEFLEVEAEEVPEPALRRLKNRTPRERIFNFDALRAALPSDVRGHLDVELF